MIPRGNWGLGNVVTFSLSATRPHSLSPSRPLAPPSGDHTELHFFPSFLHFWLTTFLSVAELTGHCTGDWEGNTK